MKNYFVKITANIPYPKTQETVEKAGKISVAVRKAVDKFKKTYRWRRAKELFIKVKEL